MITVDSTLRKCPYCAELIKVEAIKCKHCGEILEGHPDYRMAAARPVNPAVRAQYPQFRERKWNPGIAALISLIIPGGGQIYKGDVGLGIIWLVIVTIGYFALIIPGLILHLICIVTAASGDPYKD